ncbi:MAG: hypothetical protein TH68_02415 [Candidatus Synechococcus spongiarum 142]|uniref:PIN domain-containing protein n=1 Tax=Candidatus Synechococcus spongiarum 142 TaxID=1608213 RepID=A0A6N3X666_9SYNE|nr:MAG: hypothetical protein TH68_02415 [Candidatus Synechococcus spongiarum 142]
MCAIVDTNAAHEVFGSNAGQDTEAGEGFFQWLSCGKGKLVVGGKLKQELGGVPKFREWANMAVLSGKLVNIDDNCVNNKTKEVKEHDELQSDDPHIIALAQVSGARLLFSNDKRLHEDFRNPDIINNPRGKIYSTLENKNFTQEKENLLDRHRCKPRN